MFGSAHHYTQQHAEHISIPYNACSHKIWFHSCHPICLNLCADFSLGMNLLLLCLKCRFPYCIINNFKTKLNFAYEFMCTCFAVPSAIALCILNILFRYNHLPVPERILTHIYMVMYILFGMPCRVFQANFQKYNSLHRTDEKCFASFMIFGCILVLLVPHSSSGWRNG